MTCRSLFSGKNKKNITILLSAVLAQSVVKARSLFYILKAHYTYIMKYRY